MKEERNTLKQIATACHVLIEVYHKDEVINYEPGEQELSAIQMAGFSIGSSQILTDVGDETLPQDQ